MDVDFQDCDELKFCIPNGFQRGKRLLQLMKEISTEDMTSLIRITLVVPSKWIPKEKEATTVVVNERNKYRGYDESDTDTDYFSNVKDIVDPDFNASTGNSFEG
uniref:Uncharacterized protein LOC114327738 n=1 Tax=Diabrotica virgifera virgifera TaxID=50390 RepID=A0A6P7FBQ1_DIAVI